MAVSGSHQPVVATLADERATFDQGANTLFQEERIALGALDKQLLQGAQRGVVADPVLQQLRRTLRLQRVDADAGVVALGTPGAAKLRAKVHQQQQ